ncbi:MAG: PhzF family phenazine biosynthesis protein, partial [Deltaproteobacteria bacterium]|nr:PhzF family phenazine biosynthesis protein [Deltaproteobacteria bacterium]
MLELRYVLVDVFTERSLTGNALAVFTDARGLDDATLQALARELALSETVFVLPARERGHARLRIFSPRAELPFAGHPTLGAAIVLGEPLQAEVLRLETGRGTVPVALEREGARVTAGWMELPVSEGSAVADPSRLLAALGVESVSLPVTAYTSGPEHLLVAVDSPATVRALAPDLRALAALTSACVSVFAAEGARVKTRMFAPALGIDEDPATGSAAGPIAAHLVRHGRVAPGTTVDIEQGAELERPSRLHARVDGAADRVERVTVGGSGLII